MSAQMKPLGTSPITPVNDHNEPELGDQFDVVSALASMLLREIGRIRATVEPEGSFENAIAELASGPNGDGRIDFYKEIERYEIELIKNALELAGGSQKRAAQLLGLNPTTLNAKIKHLGIYRVELIAKHSAAKTAFIFRRKGFRERAMDTPTLTSDSESLGRRGD